MPKKNKKSIMIVGFGGIAGSWLRNIRAHGDWEVTGIVDTDTEKLEAIPKLVPEIDDDMTYTQIEHAEMFGDKPDAVVICTPISTHHGLAKEAMDLGIHTIVEKNMASNIPQARQLVQKAIEMPHLCTAVGTQYRYGMAQWVAKQFFQSGTADETIGKLGMILWEDYGYRGERRWGWRRFLQDVYLEDMSVHWFDTLRYVTGMNIVQVKSDVFMPRYSDWHGSSTVFASLALAKPEDYGNRHEWVWCQFAGDWQKQGPTSTRQELYGKKGFAKIDEFGVLYNIYKNPANTTQDFEEDAFIGMDAGSMEGLGTSHVGQAMILEMMSRGIDSGGEQQPGTNFKEAFKSFAVSMACRDSSFAGNSVWVPGYWKGLLED